MKLAELHLDGDIITVHNSMWTGVETVYFNGRRVSRQFNWFVGIHHFNVVDQMTGYEDRYRVELRMSLSSAAMVSVDIFRNGVCVLDQSGRGPVTVTTKRDRRGGSADNYDRRPWTQGPEKLASPPPFREEDLV